MIFDALRPQPPDPLLALIRQFDSDGRPGKMDLGVGTYRDEQGRTPVMHAVKNAERLLWERQETKSYLAPEGDLQFVELLRPIAFGAGETFSRRLVGVQTPGGSGALRLGAELVATARPNATVWLGQPTWPNHRPVLEAARLRIKEYRYFDPATQSLCFENMLKALSQAPAGDVVLLQGCCHNPAGADLNQAQWQEVAAVLARRGLIPFLDLAYQGLGRSLDRDAYGVRHMLASVEEALVAYSCDKNFGLYRERTGALFVLGRNDMEAAAAYDNMAMLARVNWSMPPDHGAAVVRCVLESGELRQVWHSELLGMCWRINSVRDALASLDPRLAFLSRQHGMFAQLVIRPDAVASLRRDYGVFISGSGRVNIAGLRMSDAERFVDALRAVGALAGLAPVREGAQKIQGAQDFLTV